MWLDRGVLRAASENYKKIHLDYSKQLCTQLALYKEHRARSSEPWILALDPITVCTLSKSLDFLCVSYQITHVNINGYIYIVSKCSQNPRSLCSVAQSCLTVCNPTDCSTPGFPVLHYLPEFAQIHVHWVGDAIQPSHPLLPSSFAFDLSQHQGLKAFDAF